MEHSLNNISDKWKESIKFSDWYIKSLENSKIIECWAIIEKENKEVYFHYAGENKFDVINSFCYTHMDEHEYPNVENKINYKKTWKKLRNSFACQKIQIRVK